MGIRDGFTKGEGVRGRLPSRGGGRSPHWEERGARPQTDPGRASFSKVLYIQLIQEYIHFTSWITIIYMYNLLPCLIRGFVKAAGFPLSGIFRTLFVQNKLVC